MTRFRIISGIVAFAAFGCTAGAATFTLNANVHAYNVNDGLTFVTDPQTTTIAAAPGTGTVASAVTLPGISAYQNINGSLTSETSGSVTYADGWSSDALLSGQATLWYGVSQYDFTIVTSGKLTIDWRSSLQATGDDTVGFGTYDIIAIVDGVWHTAPVQWPPTTSGTWVSSLGAGAHSVQFLDWSNLWGQWGTRNTSLNETLNWNVTAGAVPEPTTLTGIGFAVVALIRRKRK